MRKITCTLLFAFISLFAYSQFTESDFENFELEEGEFLNGDDLSGGFLSGNTFLTNMYDTNYDFWSGWAISATTDTTTPGFANQYSCIAGTGEGGSQNYAVSFLESDGSIIRTENEAAGGVVDGLYVNNSTYAYLSMLDGDQFAKKFGGESGDDPDFFVLTIKRYFEGQLRQDSIDFYLADYRFDDNSQDFLVNEWTYIDLSSLGNVDSLSFTLRSSDNGAFGMNTPAYICIDNIRTRDEATNVLDINNNKVSIYPNPVADHLYLEIPSAEEVDIVIRNIAGEYLQNHRSLSLATQLDLSELEAGMYIITVNGKDWTGNTKFLKI